MIARVVHVLEYGSCVCMERFASDLFPVYRIILQSRVHMQNFVFLHPGSKFSTGVYFGHTNAGLILKDFALFLFKLLSIKKSIL